MEQEARIVAGLEHPGIVPIHDAGTLPDGRVFYAMKRVRGNRLDEHAERSLPALLRIFEKICEAVAFAHAHGVIHRDLKPGNVMVGSFGEVLVMDWGVAKLAALAHGEELLPQAPAQPGVPALPRGANTRAGSVVGTPGYMAPERRGETPPTRGPTSSRSARSPIFSSGGSTRRFPLPLPPVFPWRWRRSAGRPWRRSPPIGIPPPGSSPRRSGVFGWSFQKWNGPQEYWLISTGDVKEPGINGGMMRRQGPDSTVCNTVGVRSLEETVRKVESGGGRAGPANQGDISREIRRMRRSRPWARCGVVPACHP